MITAPDPTVVSEVTPTLAKITSEIIRRPIWARNDPYPVDGQTFVKAEREMTEILKARGWRGPGLCADIPQQNFLLMGVPVVRGAK